MTPRNSQVLRALGDLPIMALTAYGEARSQSVLGLVAVLCVLRNRLAAGRWGMTLTDVALAYRQFSCWNDEDPNLPKLVALAAAIGGGQPKPDDPTLDVCLYLAERVIRGELRDPTGDALFYYAASMPKPPAWAAPPAIRTVVIGAHSFYRNVT
jgi:spore germination cell wall hydrolase CwlJ-like protein